MSFRPLVVTVTAMVLLAGGGFAVLQSPELRERGSAMIKAAQGVQSKKTDADDHKHGNGHGQSEEHAEGAIKLTAQQIESAKITVVPAQSGVIERRISVPGAVIPDADRVGRVAAKVVGTVAEMNKQLGEPVAKGEVVAILDSREVAEAKSEYLAASVNFDLQKALFEREQLLFQKKVSAEQQFLRARTAFSEVQLRVDLARQKLSALGVPEKETAGLSRQSTALQRYELRAPIAGRIVERLVNLGAPVGGEGQAKELYGIADLSKVWVEMAVPPAELAEVREEQSVSIVNGTDEKSGRGKVIFISPLLDNETRSARVVAEIDNADGRWRPGTFVTAAITVEEVNADLTVPRTALQTIGGETVVFVRTEEGFEKREIVVGKGDDRAVEVVFGLDPGEPIATGNSFVLKAELGKAEADHGHAH